MNIIKEQKNNLSAQIKISIDELDYQDRVKKELNKVRGKAQMPGFRQGHVPFGMIQKMYGQAVLVEEINKILQESVGKFLEDEKINLLGSPFPAQDSPSLDFEKGKQFDFTLNVLLAPEVNLDFLKTFPSTYYKIKATDSVIDEQITTLRQRFGTEEPDPADPEKTVRKECEINEEFFKKAFPHKEIKTEKELRTIIAEEYVAMCAETVGVWFFNAHFDMLVTAANLSYNDEMLRQYMEHQKQTHSKEDEDEQTEEAHQEGPVSDEEFEKNKKGTSWQLIQQKLMEIYGIKVEPDEIKEAAKEQISRYFGIDPKLADAQLGEYMNSMVDNVMKDKKQLQELYNRALDKKMTQVLMENTQMTTKEATWDEFLELIDAKKEKKETQASEKAKPKAQKPSTKKTKKEKTDQESLFE
jgi:FKBP-type peptidyl-prolyl cis-trans isomerase (trigger factor)